MQDAFEHFLELTAKVTQGVNVNLLVAHVLEYNLHVDSRKYRQNYKQSPQIQVSP